MNKIVFLNRFFFPDHSATGQLVSDLAFHLATLGKNVHVITSRQRYDDPAADLPERESIGGVEIHRVSTTKFGRAGLLGRAADYLSYYWGIWRALSALVEPGDVIVPMTDPPVLSIVVMPIARRHAAYLVTWLQDLYPEVAVALGVPLIKGPIASAIRRLRDRALRAADNNVVVGERMAERLRSLGVERICVIPNWTDDEEIKPIAHADNPLRQQWGFGEQFVVGYSGNLGRAHDIDTMLEAARLIRDFTNIVFACIGGGCRFDELASRARACGLEQSFRFFPYQDRRALRFSLAVADVHWVSLRPELEGLIVPSKLYGIAAAGRPVIAIAAKGSEISRLVEKCGCGVAIEAGDATALAETLLQLAQDRSQVATLGHNARAMLDARFTRAMALERWRAALDSFDD